MIRRMWTYGNVRVAQARHALMSVKFKARDYLNHRDPIEIEAFEAREAAELYAELIWAQDGEPFESLHVEVKESGPGVTSRWAIRVEHEPTFKASRE